MGKIDCSVWLKKFLNCEIRLCENVRAAAKENGYTKAELKQARKEIGVKTFHQFRENGPTENWFWYLEGENERKRD